MTENLLEENGVLMQIIEKVPKGTIIPKIAIPENSSYVIEAKKYVEENFAENYGTLDTFSILLLIKLQKNILSDL